MSKHTKEPWVLFEVGDRHVHLCPASAAKKTSILTVTEEDGVTFAAVYSNDDARRIVACVNACRGLPTDELEQNGLVAAVGTQLLKADDRAEGQEREIHRLANVAANAENQLADALNQRDELLAALELMVAIHDEPSGFSGKYGKALDNAIQAQREKIDERLLVARTTIAKAKGGAS
ncbi:hypothetical protein [Aeromonas enteropelogenes]